MFLEELVLLSLPHCTWNTVWAKRNESIVLQEDEDGDVPVPHAMITLLVSGFLPRPRHSVAVN